MCVLLHSSRPSRPCVAAGTDLRSEWNFYSHDCLFSFLSFSFLVVVFPIVMLAISSPCSHGSNRSQSDVGGPGKCHRWNLQSQCVSVVFWRTLSKCLQSRLAQAWHFVVWRRLGKAVIAFIGNCAEIGRHSRAATVGGCGIDMVRTSGTYYKYTRPSFLQNWGYFNLFAPIYVTNSLCFFSVSCHFQTLLLLMGNINRLQWSWLEIFSCTWIERI